MGGFHQDTVHWWFQNVPFPLGLGPVNWRARVGVDGLVDAVDAGVDVQIVNAGVVSRLDVAGRMARSG